MRFKNGLGLMSDVVRQIDKKGMWMPVATVYVQLYEDSNLLIEMNIVRFMDSVANDLFFDESTNWSDANRAQVVTL